MPADLARDEEGNALTAFHPPGEGFEPLPLALVAWWHEDRLLLVLNRHRQCWELPGGLIDPGETPYEAAIRELREETGLECRDLALVGYARFRLGGPDGRTEYGALYRADARPGEHRFTPNEEISAIRWWDGTEPLAERAQPIDLTLAELAKDAARRSR